MKQEPRFYIVAYILPNSDPL